MNELALFAGHGGGLLASMLAGWRTVCAVEFDEYSRCVLAQRQNERHIRDSFPIWDDVRTFDGRAWRGVVDVVSGGFPCQAYSTAASGKNIADDLWPEMRRIVADVVPRYVFAENTSSKAIDAACDDLESMGYETRAITIGAKDLGADHVRDRSWLLAYADDKGELLRGFNAEIALQSKFQNSVWQSKPDESRMDDGVAYRMERFKGTGNGQVPIVAIAALVCLVRSE